MYISSSHNDDLKTPASWLQYPFRVAGLPIGIITALTLGVLALVLCLTDFGHPIGIATVSLASATPQGCLVGPYMLNDTARVYRLTVSTHNMEESPSITAALIDSKPDLSDASSIALSLPEQKTNDNSQADENYGRLHVAPPPPIRSEADFRIRTPGKYYVRVTVPQSQPTDQSATVTITEGAIHTPCLWIFACICLVVALTLAARRIENEREQVEGAQ